MKKVITVTLPVELIAKLDKLAEKEKRSRNNLIVLLIEKYSEEVE